MPGYQDEHEKSQWYCISAVQSVFLASKLSMSLYLYRNFNLELAFFTMSSTTLFPDRSLSILSPKYLTLFTLLISTSPHLTLNESTLFNFLLVPKRIASVLPRCSESLLSTSHCLHDSNYLDSCSVISHGFKPRTISELSSTYKSSLHLMLIGISLT